MAKLEISRVHDAYARPGECPLCTLEEDAERTYLKSFQHSRVMEPNVRVQTNRQGFCPAHCRKLYDGENKLGLGLVVHTRLQQILPEISALLDDLDRAAGGRRRKDRVDAASARLAALRDSCFICALLREDTERYIATILYLWSRDPEFSAVFRSSRGFCVPHFASVLDRASKSMRADGFRRWLAETIPLMKGSLERLERDLHAFTQLHQADNASLGTDAVRSALARTLQKIAGGIF
ncbi:MAG: DUF6062 family protein [Spirochaetia bacterium]